MKKQRKIIAFVYETFIIILAIIAVTLTILDFNHQIVLEPNSPYYWIDLGILVIFAVDYFVRLFAASDKKEFFKSNLLGLIAIIPFNSMFRIFRAFRVFRLLRITQLSRVTRFFRMARLIKGFALLGKIKRRLNIFVNTNGLIYAIYVTLITMILGTVGVHYFEFQKLGYTLGDSLWWSFVTTSTAGYGDIIPVTWIGRVIAIVLMLVGISFVGLLTGTITTYFLNRKNEEALTHQDRLTIDVSDLDDEKVQHILEYVEFVRTRS